MMAPIVCDNERFSVPLKALVKRCDLYDKTPSLANSPYHVRSHTTPAVVAQFLSAVEKADVYPTTDTVDELESLSLEFGFGAFKARLSTFRESIARGTYADSEARNMIHRLEVVVADQGYRLAALDHQLKEMRNHIARLEESAKVTEEDHRGLKASVDLVRIGISLNSNIQAMKIAPTIFAAIAQGQWTLLYRGSRDGFAAKAFHRICDGKRDTLTVVEDKDKNVFGGFTPVPWESSAGRHLSDPKGRGFLFTIINPGKLRPRVFAVKSDATNKAIYCSGALGPCFGERDLWIGDACDSSRFLSGSSNTCERFGTVYQNDTGTPGNHVLATHPAFLVSEIEVFQVVFD
jgi:hypothetical protein